MAEGIGSEIGGFVKEHPVLLVTGILLLGVALYLLLRGGGGAAPPDGSN